MWRLSTLGEDLRVTVGYGGHTLRRPGTSLTPVVAFPEGSSHTKEPSGKATTGYFFISLAFYLSFSSFVSISMRHLNISFNTSVLFRILFVVLH